MSLPLPPCKKKNAFAGPDLRNCMQIIQSKFKKNKITTQGNQTPNFHTKGKHTNHSPNNSFRKLNNCLPLGFFKPRLLGNHTVYKKIGTN